MYERMLNMVINMAGELLIKRKPSLYAMFLRKTMLSLL